MIRFAAGSHVSCFMACRKLPWSPVAFEIFLLKVSSKSDRDNLLCSTFFCLAKTHFFSKKCGVKKISRGCFWRSSHLMKSEVSAFENLYLTGDSDVESKKNRVTFFLLHISVLFWVSKVHRGKSQKVPLLSDDENFSDRLPPFLRKTRALK